MTLKTGKALTASNLDEVPRTNVLDLYEFKFLSRPSEMAMAELKALFGVLDINPALLDNQGTRVKGVEELRQRHYFGLKVSNSHIRIPAQSAGHCFPFSIRRPEIIRFQAFLWFVRSISCSPVSLCNSRSRQSSASAATASLSSAPS